MMKEKIEIRSLFTPEHPDLEAWEKAQSVAAGFDPETQSLDDLPGVKIIKGDETHPYIVESGTAILAALMYALGDENSDIQLECTVVDETISPEHKKSVAANELLGYAQVRSFLVFCLARDFGDDLTEID